MVGGVEVQFYSFFNLGARRGGWSMSRPGRLYPEKTTGAHCIGDWVGLKDTPTRGRNPDCPARSESLYWLSYPGCHHVITLIAVSFRTVTVICSQGSAANKPKATMLWDMTPYWLPLGLSASRWPHLQVVKEVIWGIRVQVGKSRFRFPEALLEFFIEIILPAALRLWGRTSL